MNSLTVLIANAYQPKHLEVVRSHFPNILFVQLLKDCVVPPEGEQAEALLFLAITKEQLSRCLNAAPKVKWIHLSSAGFDWAMVPEVEARGIVLTRSAEAKKIAVAEFTIAFMLLMIKRFPTLLKAQAMHQWTRPDPDNVRGKTIGIIGAGAIGCEVARLASGLGMRVIGVKRTPQPLAFFDQVLSPNELPTVLQQSDFVVLACPANVETNGMMAAEQLRMMKRTAYLINVARGAVIVEADLLHALKDGWIAGACLDAVDEEPLPAQSALWDAPNVIITPHCAYSSPSNIDGVVEEFIVNLERLARGDPLLNTPKNPELGY